ncbi:MAG: 30S ribosomal protein S19e [Candidatus Thalassarchaeaceae archaeon]|nr:30S ribosomal protein S19e [Euryarchaeota archaeon]OUW78782.1 MAG: 30S ribosomal protein S19e [Euryarchaeota archaeon TMED215]|tara:strand:+ start:15291 stop:15761 length:471 start_codon:yes stop_codon:yes gene_type:complete
MTTYHDVPADLLIGELSARLSEVDSINPPEWSKIVKTGTHRERPPAQDNWWYIRSAAVLRKVGKLGPIGANHMAQHYGGPKDRGVKPNRAVAGSRNISRTVMQQLTTAGLIQSKMNLSGTVNHGKVLTPAGQKMLDSVAHAVRDEAIERHPGLSNY